MAQGTKDAERLISGLKEGTRYRFEVSAENAWGVGRTIKLIVLTKQTTSKLLRDYFHQLHNLSTFFCCLPLIFK